MNYEEYIGIHQDILTEYWQSIMSKIISWKDSYEWPPKVYLAEAMFKRNQLELSIRNDVLSKRWLSKKTFDSVMVWGFGRPSYNSEKEIQTVSYEAFNYLSQDKIEEAALSMTKLNGIGISRASKVLALSDQMDFGIYDSRAADGISDLIYNGKRLIPIPPGRAIAGDNIPKESFCSAFRNYIWVLRFFREQAKNDNHLRQHFKGVSDFEIAFFARSRNKNTTEKNKIYPVTSKGVEFEEGDCYFTLGYGNRAKCFWTYIDEEGITLLTGAEGKTQLFLQHDVIDECLNHFKDKGSFPLGNSIDNVKPDGLGEYFLNTLKKSPKFASHVTSILVSQGRLKYKYGDNNGIELIVV